MADSKSLWGLEIFKGLTEEELSAVATIMTERDAAPGDFVFREDEHGDSLFVIQSGEVEITLRISEELEEFLAVIREGSYFGEMALVDPGHRSASARAKTNCKLLSLVRRDFFELAASDNALGIKVFLNLSITLTERLRSATQNQRQAMLWGHQISGATHLNFYRLISNNVTIQVELLNGKSLDGVMLKVDETRSGHEITIKDSSECIHIIPYHAICRILVRSDNDAAYDAPTIKL